ncbi:MAG: lysophospholipid acyltransferase family protein [Phycisphaeraceae bacterium]
MFERFRQRQPGAPLGRIIFWHVMHALCVLWFLPLYRYRAYGRQNIPRTGPVLLVSNHQSFFDPILVGMASWHRQFYALARKTLWSNRLVGWLISMLNAIPVDRGTSDTAAMRKCVEVLKQGHALLVFAEGERSHGGEVRSFQPGIMLVIRRARPLVVPVALEGANQVWPRKQKRPHLTGRTAVSYGEPIPSEDLLEMKPGEALELLRSRVEAQRQELAAKMGTAQPGRDADPQTG